MALGLCRSTFVSSTKCLRTSADWLIDSMALGTAMPLTLDASLREPSEGPWSDLLRFEFLLCPGVAVVVKAVISTCARDLFANPQARSVLNHIRVWLVWTQNVTRR
jgi:hypothetical protein